jgi:hypothetical protein
MIPKAVAGVLTAARRWAHARNALQDLTDRKSTKPPQLEAAKKSLFDASNELFKAVSQFEKFLQARQTKKTSFDWAKVFGAVAQSAKFLEGVSKGAQSPHAPPIVDTFGEEVR